MNELECTHCGTVGLEPGFLDDTGQSSAGFVQWIEGALERGIFGGAKRMGRRHWEIDAWRCPECSHLELFATDPA